MRKKQQDPNSSDPQPPDPAPRRRPRGRDPRTLPLYRVFRRFRTRAAAGAAPRDAEGLGRELLRSILEERPQSSPVLGVRLYRAVGDRFELIEKAGDAGDVEPGYLVPADHPIIVEALRTGFALARRGDPRFDSWVERTAGPAGVVAKLPLGPAHEILLSLTLREPIATADVLNALEALRSFVDSLLARQQFHQLLEQALHVQTSLLPRHLPAPPGFELAVKARPAEIVGGDIYDVVSFGPDAIGVCVADATGHGLPAALQARDVIIGLRMGIEQQLRMVATVEKLSRILAGSSAPGRYVSLFFGEIDRDGHLLYINAGHPPPLLIRAGGKVERLRTSGPILGIDRRPPHPWKRLFERLEKGDLLALYTDGLTEVRRADGEELGSERLARVLKRNLREPLPRLCEQVFAEVDAFDEAQAALDDQTLLLIRRS